MFDSNDSGRTPIAHPYKKGWNVVTLNSFREAVLCLMWEAETQIENPGVLLRAAPRGNYLIDNATFKYYKQKSNKKRTKIK